MKFNFLSLLLFCSMVFCGTALNAQTKMSCSKAKKTACLKANAKSTAAVKLINAENKTLNCDPSKCDPSKCDPKKCDLSKCKLMRSAASSFGVQMVSQETNSKLKANKKSCDPAACIKKAKLQNPKKVTAVKLD